MNHIIYHDHCIDGFGAAFIAARFFETMDADYSLIPHSYGDALEFNPGLESADTIFILDYSFDPVVIENLCGMCKEVVWLDHHKTAIDKWDAYLYTETVQKPANLKLVLDKSRSGTGITFDWFYSNTVRPMWVHWIEDRDLWKFQYGETSKAFHAAISSYPRVVADWYYLLTEGAYNDYENLVAEGAAILRAHTQRVKEIADGCAVPIVIDGQKGFAANCSGYYASDVGHELAERSGTFGATWYQNESGDIKWSLRAASNNKVDVAEIASKFGGGGHRSAAGFVIKHSGAVEINPTIQLFSSVESEIEHGNKQDS